MREQVVWTRGECGRRQALQDGPLHAMRVELREDRGDGCGVLIGGELTGHTVGADQRGDLSPMACSWRSAALRSVTSRLPALLWRLSAAPEQLPAVT
jgi:hypothetical protein